MWSNIIVELNKLFEVPSDTFKIHRPRILIIELISESLDHLFAKYEASEEMRSKITTAYNEMVELLTNIETAYISGNYLKRRLLFGKVYVFNL